MTIVSTSEQDGIPMVEGGETTVLEVYDAYEVYDVPAQKIANDYNITIGDVYEALAYYYRNPHIERAREERGLSDGVGRPHSLYLFITPLHPCSASSNNTSSIKRMIARNAKAASTPAASTTHSRTETPVTTMPPAAPARTSRPVMFIARPQAWRVHHSSRPRTRIRDR